MYKIILSLIVFLLTINISIANPDLKNSGTDSIINQQFNNLQTENANLRDTLNSLDKELSLFTEDAKHYDDNLSRQTEIFSTIVVLLASLIGFISYGTIKLEIREQKKDFEKQTNELKEIIKEQELQLNDAEIRLYALTANSYINLSNLERKNGNLGESFMLLFSSCYNAFNVVITKQKLYKIKNEKKYNYDETLKTLIVRLKETEELFNDIKNQNSNNTLLPNEKEKVVHAKEFMLNIIDDLMLKSDISEIKDTVAKLRIGISSFK